MKRSGRIWHLIYIDLICLLVHGQRRTAFNDVCGLTKTKATSEFDVNESEYRNDFGFAKNRRNPTTFRFGFEIRQKFTKFLSNV